jgi:hypothetical protein
MLQIAIKIVAKQMTFSRVIIKVMKLGRDTYSDPLFQKALQTVGLRGEAPARVSEHCLVLGLD